MVLFSLLGRRNFNGWNLIDLLIEITVSIELIKLVNPQRLDLKVFIFKPLNFSNYNFCIYPLISILMAKCKRKILNF